jgi:hypothetical protein
MRSSLDVLGMAACTSKANMLMVKAKCSTSLYTAEIYTCLQSYGAALSSNVGTLPAEHTMG